MEATLLNPLWICFTQGDPAGIGPELLLRRVAQPANGWRAVVVAERQALTAAQIGLPEANLDRFRFVDPPASRDELEACSGIPVIDPTQRHGRVRPGSPTAADAQGALAALDLGHRLAASGRVDALVTLPVSKAQIAEHCDPGFRGHTDHLAAACGLQGYGQDYLMAFLAPRLRVALLTVHQPLRQALDGVTESAVVDALTLLARHQAGRIALAGLNPHAGEGGWLGSEETEILVPAVAAARARGVDVVGPESPDSVFGRAREGRFDWVLALYHDQGLIAVKTAARGQATNWTLGLPYLRTSVDHGTAFDIAGRGTADDGPLAAVIATTLELVREGAG